MEVGMWIGLLEGAVMCVELLEGLVMCVGLLKRPKKCSVLKRVKLSKQSEKRSRPKKCSMLKRPKKPVLILRSSHSQKPSRHELQDSQTSLHQHQQPPSTATTPPTWIRIRNVGGECECEGKDEEGRHCDGWRSSWHVGVSMVLWLGS